MMQGRLLFQVRPKQHMLEHMRRGNGPENLSPP